MTNHRTLGVPVLLMLLAILTSEPLFSDTAFVEGMALSAAGKHVQAASKLALVKGPARPWALLNRARSLAKTGDAASARKLLLEFLAERNERATDGAAYECLADCEEALGSPLSAATAMQQALGCIQLAGTRADGLTRAAELWRSAGDEGRAYEALLTAAELPGESTESRRRSEAVLLSEETRASVLPALQAGSYSRWAQFLGRRGHPREALAAAALVKPADSPEERRLEFLRSRWESQLGRREDAALRLNALVDARSTPPQVRVEALGMLARIAEAGKDVASQRRFLSAILSGGALGSPSAAARLELADLEEQQGNEKVASALRRFVIDRQPGTDAGAQALWERARELYAKESFQEAARHFEAYCKHHGKTRLAQTARYWQGLAELRGGKGRATLREIVRETPGSLFGSFAAARLEGKRPRFAPPKRAFRPDPSSPIDHFSVSSLSGTTRMGAATLLIAAEDWRDLALLLECARREQPRSQGLRLDLSAVYSRMGWHSQSLRIAEEASSMPEESPTTGAGRKTSPAAARLGDGNASRLARLLYPVPHADRFQAECRAANLDPFLALAVAREESRFLADNRSRSDARGLMQVLPTTGRWLSDRNKIPGFQSERLYEPAFNIRIGVAYLAYLRDRYDGAPNAELLMMAAYNGGPGNVDKWLRQFGSLPFDEFLERIPLEETRTYVKKVTKSLTEYSRTHGSS